MKFQFVLTLPFYDPDINCSIYNFRPCKENTHHLNIPKRKIIFRSSLIDNHHLNKKQKFILSEKYRIKTIINLTSSEECLNNKFNADEFMVHHIPFESINTHIFKKNKLSSSEYYDYLVTTYLKNKNNIKNIISLLESTEGNSVFHCSAGIDRTGIISAFYLKNQGYDYYNIIKDFQYNFYYLLRGGLNKNLSQIYENKSCLTILTQLRNKKIGFSQFIKHHL